MKTLMRCLVVVILVGTISIHSNAQWVQTGLYVDNVSCFALSDTNLFAGTDWGVFLSTNNGASWTQTSLDSMTINTFVVNGANLFAGTFGEKPGVFLSTNNGASWSAVNTGLPDYLECNNAITTLTVSPKRGGSSISTLVVSPNGKGGTNLFAAYVTGALGIYPHDGVYISTNSGTTWTQTSLDSMEVNAMVVNDTNLFAGTAYNGVFLSTNHGINWTVVNNNLVGVGALAVRGKNLFAGTDYGVYMSTDNGANWTSVNTGLPTVGVYNLTVFGTNLFAGIWGYGVFLSTNNGTNWTAVNNGLSNMDIQALSVAGTYLFAGTYPRGAYRRPLSEMIPTTDSLLVPVTGGTFTAGTTPVTISSFKMDKYEVTYEKWTEVRTWALTHGYTDLAAGKNGYNPVGNNNPVDSINWFDVVKWCNARSEKDGLTPVYYTRSAQDTVYRTGEIDINVDAVKWTANGYRLPTEAEWEFAAKGGTLAQQPLPYTYSGSNTIDSVAWYGTNSGGTTYTVGTKQPNELGVYDMSGNVWEWCWDWWGSIYPTGGTADPKGSSTAKIGRVVRGGNIRTEEHNCQVVERYGMHPIYGNEPGGFRCVQSSKVGTAVKGGTRTPQTFALAQNYPNPFNPSTTIKYSIPERSTVRLSIFNTLGQKISEMVNEVKDAGCYEQTFNASQLSSGIYFFRIEATSVNNSKTFVETKKMVLMR